MRQLRVLGTDTVNQSCTRCGSKRSAFLAQADKGRYTYYPGFSRLVFRKVLFNIGSGYNPETSVFTAPYAGVYIFSYQVFPAFGNYVRVDIKRNGETLLRSRMLGIEDGNGKSPVSTAASVTAHAQHGDQFWLEIAEGAGNYWGLYHTFFSGTLVSAD
ncbi:hypothetical protein BaRGS_00033416 [Batillaria attramentaria]|uniref:C1q domain-containing protein n=1 Tax=Batillaria attramentaria TaxID=370345 RepID=A0ABD0JK61_9CAEN